MKKLIFTLAFLAGCAAWSRDCQSCGASNFGSDWTETTASIVDFKHNPGGYFKPGVWVQKLEHGNKETDPNWDEWAKISAARCARTSYLTHDGRRDVAEDVSKQWQNVNTLRWRSRRSSGRT